VGVRVKTNLVKEVVVKKDSITRDGRVNIKAYDSNGNRLIGTNPMYVLGSYSTPLEYSEDFGGVYRSVTRDVERFFKVRDEVAYVDIIINDGDLVGFTVECISDRRVAIPYKVL